MHLKNNALLTTLNSTTCQEYFPKVSSQSQENSRRERLLTSPPIRIPMGRFLF